MVPPQLEFIQPLLDLHLLLSLPDLLRPLLGGEKSKQPKVMSPQEKTPCFAPLQRQRNPSRLDHRIRASKRRVLHPPSVMTPWVAKHQIDPSPVHRKLRTWTPQLQLSQRATFILMMTEIFLWAQLQNRYGCRCLVVHKPTNHPPHLPTEKSNLLVVKADTYGLKQHVIAHIRTSVPSQHAQSSEHHWIGEWNQRVIKAPIPAQKACVDQALPRLDLPQPAHVRVFQLIPVGVLR
jgi:hypothetical protein